MILTGIYHLGIPYYWAQLIDYMFKRISAKSSVRSSARHINVACNGKFVKTSSILKLPVKLIMYIEQ
jgi:hypothetical protein